LNCKLLFHDQLSFGTIKIFTSEEEFNKKINLLGLDIMDSNTTIDNFILAINKKSNLNKEIGIVLMNQKVIAGVGNYLCADSLWYSKISPFRKIKNLSNQNLQELFDALRLLTWSIYDYKLGVKLKIIDSKR
jgi:formamidopyrimidine-DNA glycosylase